MIRPAGTADVGRIVEMAQRFLASTFYGHIVPSTQDRLEAFALVALAHGVILVAEQQDGAVQGMIALVSLEHPLTGERYADELAWWVEPEYRTGTIGPRLLMEAERWARDQGCVMVKMVAPHATHVGLFYEHCGYGAVETAYSKRLH